MNDAQATSSASTIPMDGVKFQFRIFSLSRLFRVVDQSARVSLAVSQSTSDATAYRTALDMISFFFLNQQMMVRQ